MSVKTKQVWKTFPRFFTQDVSGFYPVSTVVNIPFTWVNSRSGTSLKEWKSMVKAGMNATTGFSAVEYDLRASRGLVFETRYNDTAHPKPPPYWADVNRVYSGFYCLPTQMPSVPFNDSSALSKAENQALMQLISAIKAQNSHFDGITFFGELREAIKLIRSISKSVASKVPGYVADQNQIIGRYLGNFVISPYTGLPVRVRSDAVRQAKKQVKPWERLRQDLYDRYLAFAFGVKPLLNDVQGAAETLARFHNDVRRVEVRGFGKATSAKTNETFIETEGSLGTKRTRIRETEFKVIYRAGLSYEATVPAFGSARRLADLSGFTLENFVPSVWNLLPFSFLVDYFTNVGDLLEFMCTPTNAIRWICRSQIATTTESGQRHAIAASAGSFMGSYEAYAKFVNRTAPSGLSFPSPEFKMPAGDSLKWLNIAALVGSRS